MKERQVRHGILGKSSHSRAFNTSKGRKNLPSGSSAAKAEVDERSTPFRRKTRTGNSIEVLLIQAARNGSLMNAIDVNMGTFNDLQFGMAVSL